jgi:two-component system chemotaxis sensor kinase CheA
MAKKDDDFLKELIATFKIEAQEHLNALSSGVLALEKALTAEAQRETLEAIFREAHSLKGAARAVNMTGIESLCQALETAFAALKRHELALSASLFDELHQAIDGLGQLLLTTETGPEAAEPSRIRERIQRLVQVSQGMLPVPEPEISRTAAAVPAAEASHRWDKLGLGETVRISTAKLDAVLRQAEELLSTKLAAGQRAAELRAVHAGMTTWEREWAKICSDVRSLQQSFERNGENPGRSALGETRAQMRPLLEFLQWNSAFIKKLERQLSALARAGQHDHQALGRRVDELLEDMKKVLMLPFSSLLASFPKLVRDLSRDRGKEVELAISGEEIEIDRRILEEMKDPLMHLVRNCIDHGIEKPEERERKRKPPCGKVTLAITLKDSSKVEILVADDGVGIDPGRVKSAAVRMGMMTPQEADTLSAPEALALIFQSGVSTSPLITHISGRGLGLAIVQEKLENLGGVITLDTHPDGGTTFRLVVPMTLATFQGVLVRVGESPFILPATYVERMVRVKQEDIQTVENRETIELGGYAVSLVQLEDVLGLPRHGSTQGSTELMPAVVLSSAEKRIAFLVAEVLNVQEVLVKGLGKQLSRVRNIAGASVLGTGEVVPILNVRDLMKSAVRASAVKAMAAPLEEREEKRQNILVVEDSITARTLLKGILEAAGYGVVTAVDGVDGYTQLKGGAFDIVVSDVDMPRMNGFDLTAKIRSDKTLADIPVVLVTALESREDREHGSEVGANAYIVKSRFDQSDLLAVIRRLI